MTNRGLNSGAWRSNRKAWRNHQAAQRHARGKNVGPPLSHPGRPCGAPGHALFQSRSSAAGAARIAPQVWRAVDSNTTSAATSREPSNVHTPTGARSMKPAM
jgi:hypothetical protein